MSTPPPDRASASAVVPLFEFHVARAARERYALDPTWFGLSGNVVIADLGATRRLALRMNQVRDAGRHPERTVQAGELHAMGLIDEVLHFVAGLYRAERRDDIQARALEFLRARIGAGAVEATLGRFTTLFPPLAVHRDGASAEDYLRGRSGALTHGEISLEELLLLWLANANPAFAPFLELFDDAELERETRYADLIAALGGFFAGEPPFGPDHQNLVDMLRSPALASPHSLAGQLEYIRDRWGHLLGDLLRRLLVTLDVIHEEERARFLRFAGAGALRGRVPVPEFRELEGEAERFSPDRDWMPRVVLIAKSTYVWLDQLSRAHGRPVHRLDEIPDAELERLQRWGITSLWLIGLWERSPASQRIKQLCGNPDAAASAYSVRDYRIAADLGGDAALASLRERAWRRGIRLASDMVPNHTGIDSRWMLEHPDRFLGLDHPPFPSYTFHGPDLSPDPRVGIFLEDHYYDRSDAAVVFMRVDRGTGATRFIYHGNDGTMMPWNDTAQLDYLKPDVREAVIRTILEVARAFPVIRFDAAMTLAKRHYQRLWFPEPGSGGAIPSRAENGLTKAEFDAAMPVEFWREVVDRVAAEAPDTLLLAEAFWLMEGFFVRTLGMHRVYNSTFMNMLRDEENANYRSVIKNTLEFDPEVLKRYVNFMSNPDERTAVDQFGKGDKYFGVCTLMITLPGLPMFGHGQVEGFAERYGMEFRRAFQEEPADRWLVERHEREIFPLLQRRHVFADVRDFLLFDVFTADGHVNEDVFAFSNRCGDDRALVLYHNRYASTAGWIRMSAAYAVKTGPDTKELRRRSLAEGLGLTPHPDCFCVFRDHSAGVEYVRSSLELHERGLFAELDAYRCQVLVDFHEVRSTAAEPWAHAARELDGRGTASVEAVMHQIRLRPLVEPFRALVNGPFLERLGRIRGGPDTALASGDFLDDAASGLGAILGAARAACGGGGDDREAVTGFRCALAELMTLPEPLLLGAPAPVGAAEDRAAARGAQGSAAGARGVAADTHGAAAGAPGAAAGTHGAAAVLFAWLVFRAVARVRGDGAKAAEWVPAWTWDHVARDALQAIGVEPWRAHGRVATACALADELEPFIAATAARGGPAKLLARWLSSDPLRDLLRVNAYEGTWWFEKEACDELLAWLLAAADLSLRSDAMLDVHQRRTRMAACERLAQSMIEAAHASGYQLDRWVSRVGALE